MAKKQELTLEDREFFSLVSRAAFINPFSDERLELDALLGGVNSLSGTSEQERLDLFMPRLTERLGNLEDQGLGSIDLFVGDDGLLVQYAWLFCIFHQYLDPLDDLIQSQLQAGDESLQVGFAPEILSTIRSRGFSHEDSLHFFALFYQLRRAYYFVEKGLVGRSQSMKKLRLALWNNVFTHDISLYNRCLWNRMEDFSTLLLGETGTGKGTAASAIGRSGFIPFDEKKNKFKESFTRTFLSINLSQYPESLIESELFGHRKGAFTGAVENHEGIFSRGSRHGALFLDEIGELSVPIQIKLLEVLQERTFTPVGSHVCKRFEGRVIAATNQPLEQLRGKGLFRSDFFYRLSSDVITVPPLRLRVAEDPAELDDLIDLLVNRIVGEPSPSVAVMIREAIDRDLPAHYPWPGNVRELEQAVRRILLAGSYAGDSRSRQSDPMEEIVRGIEEGVLDARELLSRYCALLYSRLGSYEAVARRTNLDPRTVKKHVDSVGVEL